MPSLTVDDAFIARTFLAIRQLARLRASEREKPPLALMRLGWTRAPQTCLIITQLFTPYVPTHTHPPGAPAAAAERGAVRVRRGPLSLTALSAALSLSGARASTLAKCGLSA